MQDKQYYSDIQKGDEVAFNFLFDKYYIRLCNFAMQFSVSKEVSEEIVADVFYKLWENRKKTNITSIRAFLYTSVKNKALNAIKSNPLRFNLSVDSLLSMILDESNDQETSIQFKEELELAEKTIENMPIKRRIIFKLNRIDGLKYKEIAEILNISIHTVQNQMVEAVKYMCSQYPNKKIS